MDQNGKAPVVAIVGGGFAGTMTAAHLLRGPGGPLEVVLIDRAGTFGSGVAYGTDDPSHLLNVPAELMSAYCEQPLHFSGWLHRTTGKRGPAEYVPRRLYREYLQSVLDDAERQAPAGRRLVKVAGSVGGVVPDDDGLQLILGDRKVRCDRLVLAVGWLAGRPPIDLPEDPRIAVDPWSEPAAREGSDADRVLVIGAGLTAVDQILSLATLNPNAKIVAASRSGALPSRHLPGLHLPAPPPQLPAEPVELTSMESLIKGHIDGMAARGHGWRETIDGLRPVTQALWGLLSEAGRRQFLSGPSGAWERHRHRMAPQVAARLDRLREEGRLTVISATVEAVTVGPRELLVTLKDSTDGNRTDRFERILVCAGGGRDVTRSGNPLIEDLLRHELVSPDPLSVGLRASHAGVAVDGRTGLADGRIHVLGPLRRGELWESTAVGEIRVQARDVALDIGRALVSASPAAARRAA
ncbi:MAG TPA: FAD/NAD(P)-binding protein [Solirubrobacterales bacterium]|nr:FAD/NAD(P)-binding protein [Solirubrobacterales bacterium]